MKIERLEQNSLSVRAYMVLREGLISGKFRPGQRLVMQDLAQQLGTSITPVREACLRLVSERGLELRSGRFAIVPEMTMHRYMQVRTIRIALEGLATELAAANATADDVEKLTEINRLYAEHDLKGDADATFRYNRDFHFGVYTLSGMDMLVEQIEDLWLSMGPMLTVFFREGDHRFVASPEHEKVIAALAARDVKAAGEAMRQDLILGGEDFLRFLSERSRFSVE
ncbi:GntR family transcriptional regulator [Ensifer soli]|uniref:GntR family transcriptional regulator n=1 Tax=Ciceribacter sp. sgz301302 TaxID=3342379 RepID=UPI0035B8960E